MATSKMAKMKMKKLGMKKKKSPFSKALSMGTKAGKKRRRRIDMTGGGNLSMAEMRKLKKKKGY